VLCEDTLADGTWLDVLRQAEHLCPRPQTIVLSPHADATLWGEVLNCGGYDLLPMPLEPHEVYAIIPMAWRHCVDAASTSKRTASGALTPELAEVS
jgi:DNA-binding NtrC family response regulator